MRRLRQIAVVSTSISILLLLFFANTVLAKPLSGRPCVVLFEVPFSDKSFDLPSWTWGFLPFSMLPLSSLAALISWAILLFQWRKGFSMHLPPRRGLGPAPAWYSLHMPTQENEQLCKCGHAHGLHVNGVCTFPVNDRTARNTESPCPCLRFIPAKSK